MTETGVIGSSGRGFGGVPTTRLGQWAVGLAAVFAVGLISNIVLAATGILDMGNAPAAVRIAYVIALLGTGLAAGVTGVIAMMREHERSWLLWLPILVGVMAITIVAFEVLFQD